MRQTLFGSLTDEPYPTKNEEAVIYIVDVAKSVGIDVNYSDTILDFQFVAKVVKELKESHVKDLEKIKTEVDKIQDVEVTDGIIYVNEDVVLNILDNHINQADCDGDCEHCEWVECPKDLKEDKDND